jgi:hypothetical protein
MISPNRPARSRLNRVLAGLPQNTTLEFFATFARFEYALIYSGYVSDRRHRAEADWAKLTNDLGDDFFAQVNATGKAATLINAPPKKLIVEDNAAKFGQAPAPVTTTDSPSCRSSAGPQ